MNRYSEVVLTSRNGMECGNEPLGDIFAAPEALMINDLRLIPGWSRKQDEF